MISSSAITITNIIGYYGNSSLSLLVKLTGGKLNVGDTLYNSKFHALGTVSAIKYKDNYLNSIEGENNANIIISRNFPQVSICPVVGDKLYAIWG